MPADAFDEEHEWEETRAIHNAQRALLAVLDVSQEKAFQPATADGGRGTPSTTKEDDRSMESVVLHRVLELHPARITVDELVREIVGEAPEFGDRDAAERAVENLGGVGLVHGRDDFVTSTRAASRSYELIVEPPEG